MNNFQVLTITHKTANINHIGKYIPTVNADADKLQQTLHRLKERLDIAELLYLATCNRLTILLVQEQPLTPQFIRAFFAELHSDIPAHCLDSVLQVVNTYSGSEAVQHIFEVAASLDSLVVGEREILRQMKAAYTFCHQHQLTGDAIRILVKTVIEASKDIYTHTKIGDNNVSVVSLAMSALLHHHPAPNARILLIGAGQTNTMAAKILYKKGFRQFAVFNRTFENAQTLARLVDGTAYTLDQLWAYTEPFDIIVTCTGAATPLLTSELYAKLLQNNADTQPRIVVDLAVPNDVDAATLSQHLIQYIPVEYLREMAAENLEHRRQEMAAAQTILDRYVASFHEQLQQRRIVLAMSDIPQRMKAVKTHALNTVFQKEVAAMDSQTQQVLSEILDYVEKKYISIPMSTVKKCYKKT